MGAPRYRDNSTPPTEQAPYCLWYGVHGPIGLKITPKLWLLYSARKFPLRQLRLHPNAAERKPRARHPPAAGPSSPSHLHTGADDLR